MSIISSDYVLNVEAESDIYEYKLFLIGFLVMPNHRAVFELMGFTNSNLKFITGSRVLMDK